MGKARDLARVIVDSGGLIATANLGNAVPADGSITSSKLADGSVLTSKIANSAITMPKLGTGTLNGFVWQGEARNSGDRNISGSWEDHIQIGSFTLSQTGIVDAVAFCNNGYEGSAGWYTMRLQLRGSNTISSPDQASGQGFHDNALYPNAYRYIFDSVPAGTYTLYLQVLLLTGQVTLNSRNGYDWLTAAVWHKN